MGFANIREWPDAEDRGQSWITSFRKAFPTVSSQTSGWVDYSYCSGSPPANFYASSPLEASLIDSTRGIYVPSVAPATQHLRNLRLMSGAANPTGVTTGRQQFILADMLLYYPFIDMDAVGEQQDMTNTVAIPRYDGGQVMAVAQSATSTNGTFTFSYTNDEGVSGRTSQPMRTFTVNGGGQITAASPGAATSFHPFCALQTGDKGVKSIESITFTAGGGGLMALVIVKPLMTAFITQECRRTTAGNLESYGACAEFASVIQQMPPRIIDGAVLGLFAAGHAGTLGSSFISGILETTWN